MEGKEIKGVIPPMLTPFTKEGKVYEEGLRRLTRFLIEKGVHTLFPCGSLGLGQLMTVEERERMLEVILREDNGRIPVLAQVGAIDTQKTVTLAKHAEKAGAAAIAIIPPFYHKYGDEELAEHYRRVVDAVSLPVYGYHNPRITGRPFSPELALKLKETGLVGWKDSSYDIVLFYKYIRILGSEFNLLAGGEEIALPTAVMGSRGFVAGSANAFPEISVELYNALVREDFVEAAKLQDRVLRLIDVMFLGPGETDVRFVSERAHLFIPVCYECLRMRGIEIGVPKAPFRPTPSELRDRIQKKLVKMGML